MIHCRATRFQSENTHSDPVQQRSSVSPLHGNRHRLCVLVSVCLHEHKTSGFLLICSAPLQISLLVSEEEAAEDEELRKMCTLTGQHWCISLISSFSTLFFFLFFMHHFYIVTVSYCCYVALRATVKSGITAAVSHCPCFSISSFITSQGSQTSVFKPKTRFLPSAQ